MLLGVLGRSPVLPVLAGASFQPVDVRDVADRLVDLVTGAPVGRAPRPGRPAGPVDGRPRPRLGDRDGAGARGAARAAARPAGPAVRDGGLVAPAHADGRITFEEFLR